MKKSLLFIMPGFIIIIGFTLLVLLPAGGGNKKRLEMDHGQEGLIILPAIGQLGEHKNELERSLYERRSVRSYTKAALTLEMIARLTWAAQGTPAAWDRVKTETDLKPLSISGATRTAASAGATHPLEIFVSAAKVENLEAGIYRYNINSHTLELTRRGDLNNELAAAALNQSFIAEAPAVIIIAAEYERTTRRYGERGIRYVHMEAGSAAQNIALEAVSLKLGTVLIGAFDDSEVRGIVDTRYEPLLIIPLGKEK